MLAKSGSRVVSLGRMVDGSMFAMFLMLLAGSTLYMFGEFYRFVVVTKGVKQIGKVATYFSRIMPMTKSGVFEFNFTHVLLLAVLVCFLSMTPSEYVEDSKKKKKKKGKDDSDDE
eukprot:gene789-840_t